MDERDAILRAGLEGKADNITQVPRDELAELLERGLISGPDRARPDPPDAEDDGLRAKCDDAMALLERLGNEAEEQRKLELTQRLAEEQEPLMKRFDRLERRADRLLTLAWIVVGALACLVVEGAFGLLR